MKVLNNTRYHDGDLQDLVDLFVKHNGLPQFRWNTDKYYDQTKPMAIVFTEGVFRESYHYSGSNERERSYVARQNWRSPHRIRLMLTDRIVTNPVESLTAPTDEAGYLTAPLALSVQILYALLSRFSRRNNHNPIRDAEQMLQNSVRPDGRPYTIRYRIGTRRRPSAASREFEMQHTARTKLSNIGYRSRQAVNGMSRMVHEAEMLLKLVKGRTEDLPFDPVLLRKMINDITSNTIPTLAPYGED